MYQGRNNRGFDRNRDRDDTDVTNARVVHLYDHSCKGTLARNNRNETLVGVIWDDRPGVLHPCIREEVVLIRDLERRAAAKLRKKNADDDDKRRRFRDDDDY